VLLEFPQRKQDQRVIQSRFAFPNCQSASTRSLYSIAAGGLRVSYQLDVTPRSTENGIFIRSNEESHNGEHRYIHTQRITGLVHRLRNEDVSVVLVRQK